MSKKKFSYVKNYNSINGKYTGETMNGIPHGKGTLYDQKEKTLYKGEMKFGLPHGKGTEEYLDGSKKKRVGMFKWGFFYKGKITDSDGNVYIGEVKEGQYHGTGILKEKNGFVYRGKFKWHFFHGEGTSIDENGIKYIGKWKNGEKNGYGTLTIPKSEKYKGYFKDDKYHGKGTLTNKYAPMKSKYQYEGNFSNGAYHGKGTLVINQTDKVTKKKDIIKIIGQWKNGEVNGKAVFTQKSNGYKYNGQFKNGEQNGKGTLITKDGTKFIGIFENLKNAKGVIISPNGNKKKTELINGNFISK